MLSESDDTSSTNAIQSIYEEKNFFDKAFVQLYNVVKKKSRNLSHQREGLMWINERLKTPWNTTNVQPKGSEVKI